MKKSVPIAMCALVVACADQTAVLYDDRNYPAESTAVVAPAPENVGKVVITAAGGQRLRCGGWLGRNECQSVRLLPGTTILRLDYAPAADSRLEPARDMDLPINVQGGHTYHIKATVARGAPGQGAPRVVLELVDKGFWQPRPETK